MLRRVIALLVAFAVLAERAAAGSPWVRCFVLWILRRAERTAAAFVTEQAGMAYPAVEGIAASRNGPDDALRLAASFKVLAAALCALLPPHRPFDRPARRGFACDRVAPVSGYGLNFGMRGPFDTS